MVVGFYLPADLETFHLDKRRYALRVNGVFASLQRLTTSVEQLRPHQADTGLGDNAQLPFAFPEFPGNQLEPDPIADNLSVNLGSFFILHDSISHVLRPIPPEWVKTGRSCRGQP